jgi:hypothetical protein
MSIWTYDGKLMAANSDLHAGEKVQLKTYVDMPGLFIVRVTATDRMYVGKIVGVE